MELELELELELEFELELDTRRALGDLSIAEFSGYVGGKHVSQVKLKD